MIAFSAISWSFSWTIIDSCNLFTLKVLIFCFRRYRLSSVLNGLIGIVWITIFTHFSLVYIFWCEIMFFQIFFFSIRYFAEKFGIVVITMYWLDYDLVTIIIIDCVSSSFLKKASLTWSLICITSRFLMKFFDVWRISLLSLYALFSLGFSAGFFWTVVGLPAWLVGWLAGFLVITTCGIGRFFDAISAYVGVFFCDITSSTWFIFFAIFALMSITCF